MQTSSGQRAPRRCATRDQRCCVRRICGCIPTVAPYPPATGTKAPTRASTSASRLLLDKERVTTVVRSHFCSLVSNKQSCRHACWQVRSFAQKELIRAAASGESRMVPPARFKSPAGQRVPRERQAAGRRLGSGEATLTGATCLDTALMPIPLAPCNAQAANRMRARRRQKSESMASRIFCPCPST